MLKGGGRLEIQLDSNEGNPCKIRVVKQGAETEIEILDVDTIALKVRITCEDICGPMVPLDNQRDEIIWGQRIDPSPENPKSKA